MVVKVIEGKEDKVTMPDLLEDLKKDKKVDYCGAIFSFEGQSVHIDPLPGFSLLLNDLSAALSFAFSSCISSLQASSLQYSTSTSGLISMLFS